MKNIYTNTEWKEIENMQRQAEKKRQAEKERQAMAKKISQNDKRAGLIMMLLLGALAAFMFSSVIAEWLKLIID